MITTQAVADTFIDNTNPTVNFNGELLSVYICPAQMKHYSILKFDLSTIGREQQIASARLKMFIQLRNTLTGNRSHEVHAILNNWNESEAVWSNIIIDKPIISTANTEIGKNFWVVWDVTWLVRKWVHQEFPNNGLAVVDENIPKQEQEIRYGSRETVNPPQLEIYFGTETPTTEPSIPNTSIPEFTLPLMVCSVSIAMAFTIVSRRKRKE